MSNSISERKPQPERIFRYGCISVAVWENESSEGDIFYTTNLQSRYQDKKGEWQTTYSINQRDLPAAIRAMQRAMEYIEMREMQGQS